jgi:two-component system cell cycle sensor histidine kinase/response regulator CckA
MTDLDPRHDPEYALLDRLHEGVLLCGPDARVVGANQAVCRFLGRERADIIGQLLGDEECKFVRVDGTPLPWEEHPVYCALRDGLPVCDVALGAVCDGSGRVSWGFVSAFPELSDDGSVRRVVATIQEPGVNAPARRGIFQDERSLASVFLASPIGICATRVSDQIVLDVNDAFLDILGFTRDEVVGHSMYELGVWVDAEGRQKSARELSSCGRVTNEEMKFRTASGAIGVSLTSMELLEFAGDLCVLSFISDITDHKMAEEALRQSEERFSLAFHSSPVCQMITTLSDGRILDVNSAYCQLLGYERAELLGRTTTELDLWAYPKEREESFKAIRSDGRVSNREVTFRARSGGLHNLVASAEPIELQGIACVISTAMDVTELQEAKEAAGQSEARFRTFIEAAPDGVFVHVDERIQFANRALARMLGAESPGDLVGRGLWDVIAPEYGELVRSRVVMTREAGGPLPPIEQAYVRLDGSRVPVEATAVTLRGEQVETHLVYARDISDRKRSEADKESLQRQLQQSQKMESVGQLAGGVAHDFNNILMIQKGYCDIMRGTLRPGDPLALDLDQIEACAQRAASLTRQLLAFSRKQTLLPRLIDLNTVVMNMHDMLGRLLGEDVELVTLTSPEPAKVKADPGQVEQVLVNLAVNARDAMPEGGKLSIEVAHVHLERPEGELDEGFVPGRYVVLAFRDTGIGMDEQTRTRVFEPFFTTKSEGKGTGLGLSMVHGIVHQSGGDVSVTSEPGKGTTFRVYLPASDEELVDEPEPDRDVTRGGGELVLVVEDEPSLRRLAVTMLEKLGYRAVAAENGGVALMMVENEGLRPDLVVTDVVMPGMRGGALMERLRGTLPLVKVVYMSGYTSDALAGDEASRAALHFLQKPFSMASLSTTIKSALAEKTA